MGAALFSVVNFTFSAVSLDYDIARQSIGDLELFFTVRLDASTGLGPVEKISGKSIFNFFVNHLVLNKKYLYLFINFKHLILVL
jgi:hypothetical protein